MPQPLSARATRYLAIVDRLVEEAAEMATRVHANPTTTIKDINAYDRIARCVRRSILLGQHLAEPKPDRRVADRRRIIRAVEDSIHANAQPENADSLHAEFAERLDSLELDEELGDRPVDELIQEICRDLGLAGLPGFNPWMDRTPADIAILHARAARREHAPSPEFHPAQVMPSTGWPTHIARAGP